MAHRTKSHSGVSRLLKKSFDFGDRFRGDFGEKARVYDPKYGRFLQTDPIGSKDDLDLYAYVGGDPVNRGDPSGLQAYVGPLYTQEQTSAVGDAVVRSTTGAAKQYVHDLGDTTPNGKTLYLSGSSMGFAPGSTTGVFVPDTVQKSTILSTAINGGFVLGTDGLGAAVKTTFSGAIDTAALGARAGQIHGALDPIAQSMRTTAVVQTSDGVTFVGSSQKLLSPAQRALLQPGEVAASGAGHAEMTAVNAAEAAGQTPVAVGVSRPPCANCAAELAKRGIKW